MIHSNIASHLNGSIWYMREDALMEMKGFLQEMDVEDVAEATKNRGVAEEKDRIEEQFTITEGGTAVVPVRGKIFPRANILTRSSGATSTEMLTKVVKELDQRQGVSTILLDVDSPGGSGQGLANLSQTIREAETKTVAFSSGGMYSAAYHFGSAADQVFVSPNAGVGSIGVYAMLMSQSDKLEEQGIDVRVVRSTPLKAKGNPMEPIDEESVKQYQQIVDTLHEQFVQDVARNRNLSPKKVRETMADGTVVMGEDAEGTNFVDGVKTRDEVMESIELDTDSASTETEQTLQQVQEEYDSLYEKHEAALERIEELEDEIEGDIDRIQELEERLEEQQEAKIENRIDELLTQAIEEEQKIRPGKREQWEEKLREDFDAYSTAIEMMDSGSAAPDSFPEESQEETEMPDDVDGHRTKDGRMIAEDQEEAEFYEEIGADYVMRDEVVA